MPQSNLTKLRLEELRLKTRSNEILDLETKTDEHRSELAVNNARLKEMLPELEATILAESDETRRAAQFGTGVAVDAETRERLALRSKATLTNYIGAAIAGRMVSGAEAELSAAAGINGIPMELWEPDPRRVEQRADESTNAPGTVGVNLQPIRPAVFAPSIAPMLGIEMPMVPSGSYAEATITTSLSAGARAKGADQDSTAAGFTVVSVGPKSISARMTVRIEDVAAVGAANFESSLVMFRQDLQLKLNAELDRQMIVGPCANNDLIGIIKRLGAATAPGCGSGEVRRFRRRSSPTGSMACGPTAPTRSVLFVASLHIN